MPTADAQPPMLRVRDLTKYFDVSPPFLNRVLEGSGKLILKAVDGVDFEIPKGKTLGLVGESGCGKSTLARLVVGLHRMTRGSIEFDGTDLAGLKTRAAMQPPSWSLSSLVTSSAWSRR